MWSYVLANLVEPCCYVVRGRPRTLIILIILFSYSFNIGIWRVIVVPGRQRRLILGLWLGMRLIKRLQCFDSYIFICSNNEPMSTMVLYLCFGISTVPLLYYLLRLLCLGAELLLGRTILYLSVLFLRLQCRLCWAS